MAGNSLDSQVSAEAICVEPATGRRGMPLPKTAQPGKPAMSSSGSRPNGWSLPGNSAAIGSSIPNSSPKSKFDSLPRVRAHRVELEHRNLQRMGDKAEQMRGMVDSPGGWTAILESFKKCAAA